MTETEARRIVAERSGGRCELCRGPATNFAHRVGAGVGGVWLPSNGLRLCGSGTTLSHGWATLHPEQAAAGGWRVLSGEHPAGVPVWLVSPYLRGWHLLDDQGGYEPLWDRHDTPATLPPCVAAAA